ncbi:MAG: ion transporter [Rhodospirillales bacterium]|nr:ion transporter [Rhodospirillales bacterium]
MRSRLLSLVESDLFQRTMIGAILANAVVFGLETSPTVMQVAGSLLQVLDRALLALFVVELGLRLLAHRARFFRDPWSVFDLVVVGIGLLPAAESVTALRTLRVLRLLRLISLVPQLRAVVAGLLAAIPGMFAITALLMLLFYVSAVIATKLFAATAPQWFGSLGTTMFTLFQIMTLEGWADIAKDVMLHEPMAWMFFVPFILVTTFTILNLFIAVIVGAMESERRTSPLPSSEYAPSQQQFDKLSQDIAALAAALRRR